MVSKCSKSFYAVCLVWSQLARRVHCRRRWMSACGTLLSSYMWPLHAVTLQRIQMLFTNSIFPLWFTGNLKLFNVWDQKMFFFASLKFITTIFFMTNNLLRVKQTSKPMIYDRDVRYRPHLLTLYSHCSPASWLHWRATEVELSLIWMTHCGDCLWHMLVR